MKQFAPKANRRLMNFQTTEQKPSVAEQEDLTEVRHILRQPDETKRRNRR